MGQRKQEGYGVKAFNRNNPKNMRKEIARLLPEVWQQEERKSIIRTQYFMFIAFNRALGIGGKRFERVLQEYAEVLDWYEDAKGDGVEEYKLLRKLREIGLEIDTLYPEGEA